MRYVCSICGYVYNEAENVPWAELPDDWKCPLCGAAKSDFAPEGASRSSTETIPAPSITADMKPLTAIETSALCSDPVPSFERLLERVNSDLNENYPAANTVSKQNGDRGALRSLTWSEKVTRILKSLLDRYAKEGNAMLENTGVYVCTICGFVYIGNDLPEVCPVCKVPNRKFEKIGG